MVVILHVYSHMPRPFGARCPGAVVEKVHLASLPIGIDEPNRLYPILFPSLMQSFGDLLSCVPGAYTSRPRFERTSCLLCLALFSFVSRSPLSPG